MSGDAHGTKIGESSAHSNVELGPAFGESNVNVAVCIALWPIGPVRSCVSGVEVSVVHARIAGEASTLPARSCARTANECAPSPSGPNESPLLHAL